MDKTEGFKVRGTAKLKSEKYFVQKFSKIKYFSQNQIWIYKFIFKQRYSISIFSCLKDLWTKRDRAKILVEWEQREIVFECSTNSKYTSLTYQIQILKILKRLQLNRLIKSKSFILNVLQRGNFQFNGIVVTTVTDFWAFWIIIC